MITIKPALSAQDMAECFRIRSEVFVTEQGVPEAEEMDEHDEHALHFLAWREGEAVGTGRVLLINDGHIGKIGRIAVDRTQRGRGVGHALVTAMEEAVHVDSFQLDAQSDKLAFYERLGYVPEGEDFLDAGILHRRMVKTVAA
jgi:ElaA protein